MKKKSKFLLITAALSLVVGGGVALATRGVKTVNKVQATESGVLPSRSFSLSSFPHFTNSFNASTGYYWYSGSDLTRSGNYINSSTEGFRQGSPMTISTALGGKIIVESPAGTDDMYAIYVPFSATFTVPAYTKRVLNLTFSVSANRGASGGGADYSTEFFNYNTVSGSAPVSYWYVPNNFTTTTNSSYSVIRSAGENPHTNENTNPVTNTVTLSYTFENANSSEQNKTIYFGMFCYVESSGKTGKYKGIVEITSGTYDDTTAAYVCNGKNFYSGQFSSAWDEFVAANNRTLLFRSDATATKTLYYDKTGGTLSLDVFTLTMGNYIFYVRGFLSITSNNANGKVTGTNVHSTIFMDGNSGANPTSSLTIDGYAVIENTATAGNRAILIANPNATLAVSKNAKIKSATHGIWIDAGTLRICGKIELTGNATNYYAITCGTSTDAKRVYIFGTPTMTGNTIDVSDFSSTFIYASKDGAYYTGTTTIKIHVSHPDNLVVGQIAVRDVSNTNSSYFMLNNGGPGLIFEKSGSTLVIAYATYTLSYSLTGITHNGPSSITAAANVSLTLTPNSGYILPASITVRYTSGGSELAINTQYVYSRDTGAVTIYKEAITGNIQVMATGIAQYTVTLLEPDGTVCLPPVTVSTGTYYTFRESNLCPNYHHTLWYLNSDYSGAQYTVGQTYRVTGNITFYAKYVQNATQEFVDEFVEVYLHFVVDPVPVSDTSDTGACRGDSGYYALAKNYYKNTMTSYARQAFNSGDEYADARARFQAWANANGETITFGSNNASFNSVVTSFNDSNINNSGNTITVICVIAAMSIVSLLALVILKKKIHR